MPPNEPLNFPQKKTTRLVRRNIHSRATEVREEKERREEENQAEAEASYSEEEEVEREPL